MYGHTHRHPIVLHASRFRFAEQRLFFSRARLFPDRIELSGWLPGKRLTRVRGPPDCSERAVSFRHGSGDIRQLPPGAPIPSACKRQAIS